MEYVVFHSELTDLGFHTVCSYLVFEDHSFYKYIYFYWSYRIEFSCYVSKFFLEFWKCFSLDVILIVEFFGFSTLIDSFSVS